MKLPSAYLTALFFIALHTLPHQLLLACKKEACIQEKASNLQELVTQPESSIEDVNALIELPAQSIFTTLLTGIDSLPKDKIILERYAHSLRRKFWHSSYGLLSAAYRETLSPFMDTHFMFIGMSSLDHAGFDDFAIDHPDFLDKANLLASKLLTKTIKSLIAALNGAKGQHLSPEKQYVYQWLIHFWNKLYNANMIPTTDENTLLLPLPLIKETIACTIMYPNTGAALASLLYKYLSFQFQERLFTDEIKKFKPPLEHI